MNDERREALQRLSEEVDDLMEEVEQALEEHATQVFMRQTRAKVDALGVRFAELRVGLDADTRANVERNLGRRVTELHRRATRLPAALVGKPAEKAADTGFFATRAGTSSRKPVTVGEGARRGPRKLGVADEVDSWCGKCGEMRTSTIAAMVGQDPVQVVCTVCSSKYKYRPEPPVKRGATPVARPARTPHVEDPKEKEKREFAAGLQSAEKVRPYSQTERYKAGEVIQHAEFGRGRVESVLPRSVLVRFTTGLKPLRTGT
jgi:hypothetical protein